MLKQSFSYLLSIIKSQSRVGIALSGGADSIALFYLLVEVKKQVPFFLYVLHFDHAYRQESVIEAAAIEKLAYIHQVPFITQRLEGEIPSSNIEDFLREKRYAFFQRAYHELNLDLLLLGHHLDDLAETVIKRILEGADLTHLSGIQLTSIYKHMTILRPLLFYKKEEIYEFVSKNNYDYFEDQSNQDPQFLRARMRKELIPFLKRSFGKGIEHNLQKLSARSYELCEYLDRKIQPFWESLVESENGLYIDFASFAKLEKVELSHFIKRITQHLNEYLSFEKLQELVRLIQMQAINKQVLGRHYCFHVDRTRLFIVKDFTFSYTVDRSSLLLTSWQSLWKGNGVIGYPDESMQFMLMPLHALCINGKSLRDWYSSHKVPVFLRKKMVVAVKDNLVYQDFLSGKLMRKT